MDPRIEARLLLTRRHFFGLGSTGIGVAALAGLLNGDLHAAGEALPGIPHFPARAKRVIYLFQSGAPSQMDLFDAKPGLDRLEGTDLPASIRMGQRLTGMTARQDHFPVAASRFGKTSQRDRG